MKKHLQSVLIVCLLMSSLGMRHAPKPVNNLLPQESKKIAEAREALCEEALEGLRQALAKPVGAVQDINAQWALEGVISAHVDTLSRLRYLDAIPVFVEHIDFTLSKSEEAGSHKIMVIALSHFGHSCVPEALRAYVTVPQDEKNKRKQEYLTHVLEHTRIMRPARIYAKGLLQETQDAEGRKRLQNLIKLLDERIAADDKHTRRQGDRHEK